MQNQTRLYVVGAFVLGVGLTAAYNKRSSTATRKAENAPPEQQLKQQQKLISRLAKVNDLDTLKKSLMEIGLLLEKGAGNIKEGIEGCIGDTPLIKIKSLSDYTGCEILVKAEVWLQYFCLESSALIQHTSSSMVLETAPKIALL
jgi:cysteine synthase A